MDFTDGSGLTSLIQELRNMFSAKKSPTQTTKRVTPVSQIQAPIKGTFYNSGNFSMTATDPKHPAGHHGVDLRVSAGTPVYPMMAGAVTNVGSSPKGGNTVTIAHPGNLKTYYAHLSTVKVHQGDRVDNNSIIGTVGNTGNARVTFPHLHFQVWKDGQIQNPANFFSVPKYSDIDKSKEKWWASPQAKQEAQAFNINEHLASSKQTLANKIDKLSIIINAYCELSGTLL